MENPHLQPPIKYDFQVHKSSSFPVEEDVGGDLLDSKKVGIAPHVVDKLGSLIMAVNKYCKATTRVESKSRPRSAEEHRIEMEDSFHGDIMRGLIRNLLRDLKLTRVYRIQITGEHDYNGRVSQIAVLVAIWRSLKSLEHPVDSTFGEDCIWSNAETFYAMVKDYNFESEAKLSVLGATIFENESKYFYDEKMDENIRNPSKFRTLSSITMHANYDFAFATTNLHSPKYTPELFWDKDNPQGRLERVKENIEDIHNNLAHQMIHFSDQRVNSTAIPPSPIVKLTHQGLHAVNRNESELIGFEIQQGGFLVVLKKGVFLADHTWMIQIARKLADNDESHSLEKIYFHLLEPGKQSGELSSSLLKSMDENHKATVTILKKKFEFAEPKVFGLTSEEESKAKPSPGKQQPRGSSNRSLSNDDTFDTASTS
ncbi:hypothetical protein B9Z55_024897 [Caenorhabditis nigoni]|uniref:Switch protein XOL-1 N-terminal domain-containing protein n=1 Tax=Caenorhabditis nigoni TaxID=1611254 RepID=A0A2G5SW99_9PELO|nr:hypothetical protein B9Z55_024897 [Caenorhabditis nigoni]